MRKTEQKLWDRMRASISKVVRLERIENLVGVGIPDVMALSGGVVTWCELKAITQPPTRATTRVLGDRGLNQDQKNWHLDWQQHGGRSCIVIGVGRELFAIGGQHADVVNEFNLAQLEDFCFTRCWDGLEFYLRRKL
jgi:hypothetical protein